MILSKDFASFQSNCISDHNIHLILPILAADRQLVELVAVELPAGHEVVHQGGEAGVVGGLEEVGEFVDDDVFEAFRGFFGEVGGEADVARGRVAASPAGFHPLDEKLGDFDAHQPFPFGDERQRGLAKLAAIPFFGDVVFFRPVAPWAYVQKHLVVAEFDGGRGIGFDDFEQVAFSPDVVAFAVEVFTRRFAFLSLEFLLLAFDPAEFGDGEDADGVEVHLRRRRDAHPAGRRVDAQVDIFDVFEHHIYGDVSQFDAIHGYQYSFWALRMRKRRSTSALSGMI